MRRFVIASILLISSTASATDVTIGGSTYTLQSHPRVFLDGAAGTLTARVKDPDGAGAQVAPQATDANPAFVALKTKVDACAAAPTYCSAEGERSFMVFSLALRWYMDNSQTDALEAAKHWLNNVELWVASGEQFACDINDAYCGRSSWADWPGFDMVPLAQAYSLIQDQMSAGERTAFYQKMFNDDSIYYEDGCTNQLQRIGGAVATFTSGSTAVTGSGLSALAPGDRVYFRPSLGYATVQSVTNDTAIVLTGAPQYALGGNSASQSSGWIYDRNAWTSSTCGLAWMLYHHSYAPAVTLDRVNFNFTNQYLVGATTVNVSTTAGLPTPPFYIRAPGTSEVMKVTEINALVLTVDRAQLNTTAVAGQYPPRAGYFTRYLPNAGNGDYASNLVLQKQAGALMMALALADEGVLATGWVTRVADSWLTYSLPRNLDMWTGFTQAGSTSYGAGRQLSENFFIASALKHIPAGGSPSLDKTGGVWLDNVTDMHLYTSYPASPSQFVPWGQPDIAGTQPAYCAHLWAPFLTDFFGESSDQAKYWNYWQRTVTSNYTAANLNAGCGDRLIPFSLVHWQQSDTSTDYRSVIPTQKAFSSVDGTANRALSFWVSRTGFSSTNDTLVFADAYSLYWTQDHIGTGAPGGYKVYKAGWVLTENGAGDTGAGANSNMLLFGGTFAANSPQTMVLDRSDSGTGWAFIRMNTQSAYASATAVTRALRYLVHFKKASSPDYLVAYDSAATSVAKTISQNQHYDKTSGQSSTMTDQTLPSLVWTGPARRVSTAVVLPSGTGVAATYTNGTNVHREAICASTDGSTCASVTAAEFLLVHKPAADITDTMPTVAALGTIDSDFVGVQIEDATAPSVAVFAKVGADQVAGSFTTTHGGTAQYVVTGLAAGTYDVLRGATPVLSDETVGEDATLAFTSVSGAFTIVGSDTPPPPPAVEITTSCPLPTCVQNQPCSTTFAFTGGTPPVVWSQPVGTLCTGESLSGSTLSGTPTVVQTCTFDILVTDAEAQTALLDDCTRTIVNPAPTLVVQAVTGSRSAIIKFATPALDGSQQCDVTVSDEEIDGTTGLPIGPISYGTSASGRSTRVVSISNLNPEHLNTASVVCGTVASGSTSFTTRAAVGGTISWKYAKVPTPSQVTRGAAKLKVYYNLPGQSASSTTDASCGSGWIVTLSLTSGAIYELRHQWLTAGDAVVDTSDLAPVVVP